VRLPCSKMCSQFQFFLEHLTNTLQEPYVLFSQCLELAHYPFNLCFNGLVTQLEKALAPQPEQHAKSSPQQAAHLPSSQAALNHQYWPMRLNSPSSQAAHNYCLVGFFFFFFFEYLIEAWFLLVGHYK
jgi:hypothetical protein